MLSPFEEVLIQATATVAIGVGLAVKIAYQRQAFFAVSYNLVFIVGVLVLLTDPFILFTFGIRSADLAPYCRCTDHLYLAAPSLWLARSS
jgi:hypothetical protein